MTTFDAAFDHLNWTELELQLDRQGYVVLPGLLGVEVARSLAQQCMAPEVRSVRLESRDLGRGELLDFSTGMPAPLEQWRRAFYRRLAVIANRWNKTLDIGHCYPLQLEDFLRHNQMAGQTRAQSHLSRLGVQDFLSLHQHHHGEQVFPLQIVAVLSEPGIDFQGGEFVLTEQRPRMQSRATVVSLNLGDVAIIATAVRPFKGAQGYYRVNLKHAISRVRQGERIGLELLFHDAA